MTLRRLTVLSALSLFVLLFAACQSTQPSMPQSQATLMSEEPVDEPLPEVLVEEDEPVVEVVTEEIEPVVESVKINEEQPAEPDPDNQITFFGEVRYIELEGGFFGIVTEDGSKFFPQYLDNNFKQDGLNVRVTALLEEEVFGIQMWGAPISIVTIQAL